MSYYFKQGIFWGWTGLCRLMFSQVACISYWSILIAKSVLFFSSRKENAHCQTSTTQGLLKATREGDVSFKAKARNLSECRSGVTGALLISSQIKSQLFTGNKGSQWGNQPPEGQMVSVQSPLTPPALALADRATRAAGETGHPANSQSTLLNRACSHMILYYLTELKRCFSLVDLSFSWNA